MRVIQAKVSICIGLTECAVCTVLCTFVQCTHIVRVSVYATSNRKTQTIKWMKSGENHAKRMVKSIQCRRQPTRVRVFRY